MISHKYRCIFVHIPRTAGTSIEYSIIGDDWWNINPQTKHIFSQTARNHYKDYWDDYFKFSVIRNPWDRLVSMTRYSSFYNIHIKNHLIDITNYVQNFPNCEIDFRSLSSNEDIYFSAPNSLYQNILSPDIDFVVKYENLENDMLKVFDHIKFPGKLQKIKCKTGNNDYKKFHYSKYYTDETKEIVYNIYKNDIKKFSFQF